MVKMPDSVSSSFLGRLGKGGSSSGKEFRCTIQLLDDSDTIQHDFKKNDTGQTAFDYVCEYLNIVEKDYFGLRFMDAMKHRYWLDPAKPILKQVKGTQPIVLRFRVKFYPSDPTLLKEEITRYQLFLQLRRDLLHGRLYCPQNEAAYLGAYIVQSELGGFNPEEHKDNYVSEYKLFLKQTAKLEDRIAGVHKNLEEQTPADAEMNFLKRAACLDTYGYDPYTVKDNKLGQLYLGVTHQGILIYQANRKIHHIKWDQLEKVDYLGKEIMIAPKKSYFETEFSSPVIQDEGNDTTLGTSGDGSLLEKDKEKKKQMIRLMCPSGTFCKHLWKLTLAQKGFFTVDKGSHVKQQVSKRRIPILLKGTRFRFSGRVLQEIKEEDVPDREPVGFIRYHVERQPSRTERGFPWVNKYSTMPYRRSKEAAQTMETVMNMEELRSKEAPEPTLDMTDLLPNGGQSVPETRGDQSPVYDLSPRAELSSLEDSMPQPIWNSTPVKVQPLEVELVEEVPEPVIQQPERVSSGVVQQTLRHVLSVLMIALLLGSVVVVVMEIRDKSFMGYIHAIPGVQCFRHHYYAPVRRYLMRSYRNMWN